MESIPANLTSTSWSAGPAQSGWMVVAAGASTCLGRNYASSAAAVHAGLSRCCQDPILEDDIHRPLVTARAPYLPVELPRTARIKALAHNALAEAFTQLSAAWPAAHRRRDIRVTSWLSLSEDADPSLDQTLNPHAFQAFGPIQHTVNRAGHAATLCALTQLDPPSDRLELAVLIGADSAIDRAALYTLNQRGHLKTQANPFGCVPGEAAAVTVLATPALAAHCALPELGQLLSASCVLESALLDSDAICVGAALSTALDRATRELCTESRRIDNLWCDLNGQPERVDELAFTLARWSPRLRTPGEFMTPASSWGDVGAATGALLIQLAFSQPEFGECSAESSEGSQESPNLTLILANSGHAPARAAALIQHTKH